MTYTVSRKKNLTLNLKFGRSGSKKYIKSLKVNYTLAFYCPHVPILNMWKSTAPSVLYTVQCTTTRSANSTHTLLQNPEVECFQAKQAKTTNQTLNFCPLKRRCHDNFLTPFYLAESKTQRNRFIESKRHTTVYVLKECRFKDTVIVLILSRCRLLRRIFVDN